MSEVMNGVDRNKVVTIACLAAFKDCMEESLNNELDNRSVNASNIVGTISAGNLPQEAFSTPVSAEENANGGIDLTVGYNTYNVLNANSPISASKITGTISTNNLPPEALTSGGGSATLSAAGSTNQPVYINASGVPTACGFKIEKVTALPSEPDPDTLYIVTGV